MSDTKNYKTVLSEQKTKFANDEGIVLRVQTVGEADKILTIFTKNYGKVEILGKNVGKLNSRRAAACNTLTHSKFAFSKSQIVTLQETVFISQFSKLKSDLLKLTQGFYAAEALNSIIPIGVPAPEIFSNFLNLLKKLERTSNLHETKVVTAAFLVKLLIKSGWLGKDFNIKEFPNFVSLEKFLVSKFESITQKRLKSVQFANQI